jgi:hypothetical protein
MVTAARFRKLALSLPEAEEKSHFEQPDFRVKNKIFAGLSPDGTRATLKLAPDVQAMLLEERKGTFTPAAGAWGRSGWTYVDLASARLDELRELVAEAWRMIAPKRVVAAHSAVDGAKPAQRKPARRSQKRRASGRSRR